MLGQVPVALQIGEHAEHGDQEAEIVVAAGPVVHLLEGERLCFPVHPVDDLVLISQNLARLPVPGKKGMGCPGHVLADNCEQLKHQTVDLGKAFVHGPTVLASTPVGTPLLPCDAPSAIAPRGPASTTGRPLILSFGVFATYQVGGSAPWCRCHRPR